MLPTNYVMDNIGYIEIIFYNINIDIKYIIYYHIGYIWYGL